jgi:HEAT repeat protein
VPALLEILNDPNADNRRHVPGILGRIGPPARMAVPSLIRAVAHADRIRDGGFFTGSIVDALARIGPDARAAIPALNKMLDERGDQFKVVLALDRIGAPPARKLLDRFLRQADWFTANELAALGPKDREAVPALRAALADKRTQVRISAAVALANIDPSAVEAIPVLIEALKQFDPEEQGAEVLDVGWVPRTLARLGPRAKAALPVLIAIVKKVPEFPELLKTLVQIDPEGTECVPVLIDALERENSDYVDVAARCLGLLGPRANASVPTLVKTVMRDFPEHVHLGEELSPQASAARALRRIGPPVKSTIPILTRVLKQCLIVEMDVGGPWHDYCAAEAVAQVLGSFGPEAQAAIPALIEAVRSREKDDMNLRVRRAAMLALGEIGAEARVAVPVLRQVLEEFGEKSRYYPDVVIALYRLAPDGKDIAERWLAKPMTLEWFYWRPRGELYARAMVLGAMGRSSIEGDCLTRRFLEQFDEGMANNYQEEDYAIGFPENEIEHLGRLGASARLAFPRLNEIHRSHPNPWVRMYAAEALGRIAPTSAVKDGVKALAAGLVPGRRRQGLPPTTSIAFSSNSSRPAATAAIVRETGTVGMMPTPWCREPSCLSTFIPVQTTR